MEEGGGTREMDDGAMESQIRTFIREELMKGEEDSTLERDESLIDRGIIDSLGLFKLVGFLEEQFKIPIEPNEVRGENFESLGHIVDFINRKRSR
jgi:acyl carrier protein